MSRSNTRSQGSFCSVFRRQLRKSVGSLPIQISKAIDRIREQLRLVIKRGLAQFWSRFYSLHYSLLGWRNRYKTIAVVSAILSLIGATAYLIPTLQTLLEPPVTDQNNLANFRSLFLAVGTALIGATAIAFSLVMFAMQVNVERMPHGLFQRLSSDVRILAAFVGSFLFAILLACISLISDKSWIALVVVVSIWTIALILALFLYAYKRALLLINPIKQLSLLTATANRELHTWGR